MAIRGDHENDDRNGIIMGNKKKRIEEEWGIDKIRVRVLGMMRIAGRTIWEVGKNDKRRVIHALKVGVALTMVSLLYLMEPLFKGIGSNAMWAVMTVVVVLEFTAGATLCKGLNRGLGTLIAGSLAFFIEFMAERSGKVFRAVFIATAVFIIGFLATYIRFVPYIKRNYDYGVLIFLLTFNLITVSSFRVDSVVKIARERLYMIAIGCGICLFMTLMFFPTWSGDDLHKSTVSKLRGLAHCIQVCVEEYFDNKDEDDEEETDPAEDMVYRGYRAVLDSKPVDEALALYASWEPRHTMGCHKFPGQQYVKVGAVLRQFGYTVVALHGCLKTEIQTPQSIRALFKDPCSRLAGEVSKVLTELAESIQDRRHCSLETLSEELHVALHDLNSAFKSQPKLFLFSDNQNGAVTRHQLQHQNEGVTPRTSAIIDFWRANKRTTFGRGSNLNPETHKSRPPSPPHGNDHAAIHSTPETPVEGAPVEKKVLRPQQSRRAAAAAAVLTSLELAEALPFAAFASLLVDLVTKLDTVIEEVEELGRIACFRKYDKDDYQTTVEVRCDKPPRADAASQNQVPYHGGVE